MTAKHILLIFLICALTSASLIFIYDRFFAQKVVAFDLKEYLEKQRNEFVNGKLDEAEFKRRMDELERVLLSVPKRKVILMGDAVIRNADRIELK